MKSAIRCYILFAVCLLLMNACTLGASKQLSADASRFAISVELLADVLENQYNRTEIANRIVLRDSIDLQLQLGGNPEVSVDPLFSQRQTLARKSVLMALKEYAKQLSHLLEGETLQSLSTTGITTASDLKKITTQQFDLSHSLNHFQTHKLISSLSGFAKILLLPKRNQELASITARMHEPLRQLSALLYLDIGSSAQDGLHCSLSLPPSLLATEKADQKICKGGLRGLMDNALKVDVQNWKQRASLLSMTRGSTRANRRALIDHIFDLQQLKQDADDLMIEVQQALVLMINAHAELVVSLQRQNRNLTSLSKAENDTGGPLFIFTSEMILIQQENDQVEALFTRIKKE
ncbi:MAG: hypothetical protein MI743_02545 [Sneathiellales bacterium]|nr:hypothetical protein [Sneathiellales bacterium]